MEFLAFHPELALLDRPTRVEPSGAGIGLLDHPPRREGYWHPERYPTLPLLPGHPVGL